MSAFLGQRRVLKLRSVESPTFPARFTAWITFGPEDAFGVAGARVRTTSPVGRAVKITWNPNDGTTEVTAEVLAPNRRYIRT